MQTRLINHFKDHFIIYIVIIFFFIIRLQLQSPWLEDWDSVQFSLGLHEYSIAKHQPHPPGYPIYILIGRILYPFFDSDLKTLTFMSVFFGTLSAIPLYFLTKKMFDKTTAIFAALLLMIAPVHWILAEVPISNITGLFFLIYFAYFLYIFEKKYQLWPIIGLAGGLILGVRLTDFPIVLGLLGLLVAVNFHFKRVIILAISFLVGILTWWIPLVIISGFSNFSDSYMVIAKWFAKHESGIGATYGIKYYFKSKTLNLLDHLRVSYTWNLLSLVIISLTLTLVRKKFWQEFKYLFLITWILSYGIVLFTLYNLDLPQYTLPLSIPFVILIAHFFRQIWVNKIYILFTAPVAILLMVLVVKYDLDQIIGQTKQIPPTIAPVLFVKDHFNPKDTILITTFTYRQFQYYAPQFANFYGVEKLPSKIDAKNVIIDYKNLRDDLPILKDYKIINSATFSQPNLYMPRIHKTNLFILSKSNL